ncbi:PWWP domain-containing protein 1-like [Tasmannia lanceolata]|uniref:PWWP domain-containing protein 1-like n=1 Tax=Tasmannia lanceolata TaxID=3420 RepID=UPI00406476A8
MTSVMNECEVDRVSSEVSAGEIRVLKNDALGLNSIGSDDFFRFESSAKESMEVDSREIERKMEGRVSSEVGAGEIRDSKTDALGLHSTGINDVFSIGSSATEKCKVSLELDSREIERKLESRVSEISSGEQPLDDRTGEFADGNAGMEYSMLKMEETRVSFGEMKSPGETRVSEGTLAEPLIAGGNGDSAAGQAGAEWLTKMGLEEGRVSSEVGAGEIKELNTEALGSHSIGSHDVFRVGSSAKKRVATPGTEQPKDSLELDSREIKRKMGVTVSEINSVEQPLDGRNSDFAVRNAGMEYSTRKPEETRMSFGEMKSNAEVAEELSVCGLSSSHSMLDEGTVALDTANHLNYGFEPGDMVWGKVKSHPWWPGHIFNEAFATTSVRHTKREGHVLVAFFGDSSYGWFDPAELIPFEPHYAEKSRQTNSRNFVKAVEEAVDELRRRRAMGFACFCRNIDNFRPISIQGFFAVDVDGYEPGGLYSVKQIKKARDSFQPVEMLSFVRQLALIPRNGENRSIDRTKNLATIFSYRKAVFEEFDETYAQAFGVQPVRPTRNSSGALEQPNKAPTRAPLSGPMVIAEALGERKNTTKLVKAKDQSKKDKYLLKRRDEPNEQRVVPKPDFHSVSQVHVNYAPLSTFNLAGVNFPVQVGGYVLQKRPPAVTEKHSLPAKEEQTRTISPEVSASILKGTGEKVESVNNKLVANTSTLAKAPENASGLGFPSVIVGSQTSQPLFYSGVPVISKVSEDRKVKPDLVHQEKAILKDVTGQIKVDQNVGSIGTSTAILNIAGQSEPSDNVGGYDRTLQRQEGKTVIDWKDGGDKVKVTSISNSVEPKLSVPVPVEARIDQDKVMEGGASRTALESVGIAPPPVHVHLPVKVGTMSTDGVHMKTNALKRPREDLISEKSFMGEKKKKKKKKKSDSGLETNLEHAQKHLKIATGSNSSRTSVGKSVGITTISLEHPQIVSQSKEDSVGTSLSSSDSAVPLPEWDTGSVKLELTQLLNDLLGLALDPFYAIECNSLAIVRQGFLNFRSLVYQKSLVSQSPSEADTPAGKYVTSKSLQESGIGNDGITSSGEAKEKPSASKSLKHSSRPDDPTKMGRKRAPSDRQEEMSAKRFKKLNQVKALASEKKAGGQKTLDGQRGERKETSRTTPSKPLKPDFVKKPDPPPRAAQPTSLVMKFPPHSNLPRANQLKAMLCRFGPLDVSGTRVNYKLFTCRVVFRHKSDAQVAYDYVQNNNFFGHLKVNYHLRDLEVPASPELPSNIKRRAEESSGDGPQFRPGAGDFSGERPTIHQQRQTGVQLKSILKKPSVDEGGLSVVKESPRVKFLLGGEESNKGEALMGGNNNGSSSNADGVSSSLTLGFNSKNMMKTTMVLPPPLLPLPFPPRIPLDVHENRGISQFSNVQSNPHFSEVERRNNNNINSVDISHQMLSLLMRCNDIVTDVKSNLGYVPYHPL